MYKYLVLFFMFLLNQIIASDGLSFVSQKIIFECDKNKFCFINNYDQIKYKNISFDNCLINIDNNYIICNKGNNSYHLKLNKFIKEDDNTIILNDPFLDTNIINVKKIGGY